jgi:hypothetical protein
MAQTQRPLPPAHPWAEAYASFVIRFRWIIIVLLLGATGVLATQIPKMDVRNDPDTLLPPTNRYVATNDYAEQNFGMGNLMVIAVRVKEGDIFQPWFINKVQEIHREMEALPESRPSNFINIAAQKIKYMGADEFGLVFQRLIPTGGISSDPEQAAEELAFLEEGIRTNPVMAPMLVSMVHRDTGENCAYEDYDKDFCKAVAAYIIADYTDGVKEIYLPWVREVRELVAEHSQDDRVEILIAGEPYFLAYMLLDLVQKWWLFVLSILIVIAVLWDGVPDLAGRGVPAARRVRDDRDDHGPDGLHRVQADHDDGADPDAAAGDRHRALGADHPPLHARAGGQRRLLQVGAHRDLPHHHSRRRCRSSPTWSASRPSRRSTSRSTRITPTSACSAC